MGVATDTVKLMAIGLLNVADDEGYFYANPILIRNAVRPFDSDALTTHGALTDLSFMGYLEIREHPTHGPIGWIPGFKDHQVINRASASKIKALWNSCKDHPSLTESSVRDHPGKEQGAGSRELLLSSDEDWEGSRPSKDDPEPKSYSAMVELIWSLAPSKSRQRSSKTDLSKEWSKIKDKPAEKTVRESLAKWIGCQEWLKDGGQFIPGIHRWVKSKQWENNPEPITSNNGMPPGSGKSASSLSIY
jgi:hypothetical protein